MAALPSPFRPTLTPADPPAADDADDRLILAQLHTGNFSRFDTFVNRHKASLLRFLLARVGAIDVAEDLAQEVFISVLRTPPAPPTPPAGANQSDSRVGTWLFTIARNRAIDHHRATLRRQQAYAASLTGTVKRASSLDPATAAALQEEHAHVTALFAELPDEQREVLSLRIFGDLTLSEISQVLAVPLNTVKSRTRYALGKISDRITQEFRK